MRWLNERDRVVLASASAVALGASLQVSWWMSSRGVGLEVMLPIAVAIGAASHALCSWAVDRFWREGG